ncbi:hypothetical protein SCARD494_10070 [Seiridium cardinale]
MNASIEICPNATYLNSADELGAKTTVHSEFLFKKYSNRDKVSIIRQYLSDLTQLVCLKGGSIEQQVESITSTDDHEKEYPSMSDGELNKILDMLATQLERVERKAEEL